MELLLGVFLGLIPLGLAVLVIVYVARTNTLTQRVRALEWEVQRLSHARDELSAPEHSAPSPAAAPLPPPLEKAVPPPLPGEPLAQAAAPPRMQEPLPVAAHRPASRTREEWEALIGGKLLNRIGAVALTLGMAFFLKYAFDNNWITETMRVAIGFLIGAVLLFTAGRAHKKGFEVFAQGLVGAGLSVLYLSVFASFNFYHLVPQVAAFVMMSAVTILAFLQAFRYDSFAVSILGLLGGFLTPLLLSTGEANEVGLFTYIALLDAGLVAVVLARDKWAVLEPAALGGTYLIYVLWYNEYYTPDRLLPTVYFLIVFWVLFFGPELIRIMKSVRSSIEIRQASASANALLVYTSLYALIEPAHHDMMGWVTLCLGAVYGASALLVRTKSDGWSGPFFRQTLTAIILLVMATAIEFTGFRTAQWWSVEALVLIYCGVRWNVRFVWVTASIVFVFVLVKILFVPESFSTSPVVDVGLLLNRRAATFVLFSSSMGVGAYMLRKGLTRAQVLVSAALDYAWTIVLFALLTIETMGFFRVLMNSSPDLTSGLEFKEIMTLSVVWMAYSLVLIQAAIRWDRSPWSHVGLVVALLAMCMATLRGIAYVPVSEFRLLGNFRLGAMVCVLAGAFIHAGWIRKRKYLGSWNTDMLGAVGVFIVIMVFCLVTGETRDVFQKLEYICERDGPGISSPEWSRLANLQQLSLSGVWLFYSIALMAVGIWRRQRGIRVSSFALFGFTILKIFIYDLSFLDTLYRIFSFIGLGVILLAVSYVYQRYKGVIFGDGRV